ncbi:LysE family translocator [Ramlibacter ginsenosidimutans]|uniref:LysE family translocator n=1 Tax=Ramlibacter ginsenosidimutans TaxID=502333 RepID=A0A934TQ74_9BURK|nr:LysE family translocator [Ramlibacter ginsenosidimutans]MBK6005379.1 LysE family translocator [Ramlibacter ginsenosidimutans]
MPDTQHLLLFIAAGLLLNLTPGPDVLYIVSNALRHGARTGVVAALGINAGCFVHIAAAAAGVSALLAASATAFAVLKWAGAAYLLWVGVKLLGTRAGAASWGSPEGSPPAYGSRDDSGSEATDGRSSLWAVFRGGFLTNALNPKVAIFFLAFVPQFIAPDTEHKAFAFVLLGTLFNIDSVAVNAGWALAAAWMARHRAVQGGMHWLDRAAGAMFVAFGLRLALSDNPSR